MNRRRESGQLLMPILVLLLLFGTFLAMYVRWCRQVYLQMRLNVVAEAVALSAGRAQAAMLNNIATLQMGGNLLFQKARIGSYDGAVGQVVTRPLLEIHHDLIRRKPSGFPGQTMIVARTVARHNKVTTPPVCFPLVQSHLVPQDVSVLFLNGLIPTPATKYYDNLYWTRGWRPGEDNPQPVHRNAWAVTHQGVVGIASSRLWLDVDPADRFANGGFPKPTSSFLGGLGVQCLYPHFNARLIPTSVGVRNIMIGLLGLL